MTPREQALFLRLAACEVAREVHGVFVLRRILRDLGHTDATMDAVTARLVASVGALRQAELFERAA